MYIFYEYILVFHQDDIGTYFALIRYGVFLE